MAENKNLPVDVKDIKEPTLKEARRSLLLARRKDNKINGEKKKIKNPFPNLSKDVVEVETTSKEEKIIKKNSNKLWKRIGVISVFFIVFIIVVGLIDIFRFTKDFFKNDVLGYIVAGSVTAVIIIIIYFLVIRPVIVALKTPMFSLDVTDEASKKEISRKNFIKLKKVAKNIIATNDNVSNDSKNLLRTFIGNKKELNITLKKIYDEEISKDIIHLVHKSATKVLLTTAISQSDKVDAMAVALINIRMIMQICVKCGYHPTYPRLSKLIFKVFRNSLIAYTISAMNLQDLVFSGINKLARGALSAIPGLSEFSKGLTQGAANALFTLRVGIITRKYLYTEYSLQSQIKDPDEIDAEVVLDAINESNNDIDSIIECAKNEMVVRKENSKAEA